MTEEERLNWELNSVRQSIGQLWAELASKNLTSERRKAMMENLSICLITLKDLLERQRQQKKRRPNIIERPKAGTVQMTPPSGFPDGG